MSATATERRRRFPLLHHADDFSNLPRLPLAHAPAPVGHYHVTRAVVLDWISRIRAVVFENFSHPCSDTALYTPDAMYETSYISNISREERRALRVKAEFHLSYLRVPHAQAVELNWLLF